MDIGEVLPASELDVDLSSIPPTAKEAITDIVVESISNALAHASATTLRIMIWIDDDRIVTEIEDNGIGSATGLRKLEDRARAVQGTCEIDSPRGVGTLVRVEMPVAGSLRARQAET